MVRPMLPFLLTAALAGPQAQLLGTNSGTMVLLTGGEPGEEIALAFGTAGLGDGPCPNWLGACTDVVDAAWFGPIPWSQLTRGDTAVVLLPVPLTHLPSLAVQVFGNVSGEGPAVDAPVASVGRDPDGDGIGSAVEVVIGTDPDHIDSDGDFLSDAYELAVGTSPRVPDTDGDGLLDWLDPLPLADGPVFPPAFDDVQVSAPGVEIRDPEFHDATQRFVW
jgi:hypothetical protein